MEGNSDLIRQITTLFDYINIFITFQFTLIHFLKSNKTHVDHQAMAYVAPKRTVSPPNGNENKAANSNGTTNGVNGAAKTAKKFPKWGGAEVCPRCERSVNIFNV